MYIKYDSCVYDEKYTLIDITHRATSHEEPSYMYRFIPIRSAKYYFQGSLKSYLKEDYSQFKNTICIPINR